MRPQNLHTHTTWCDGKNSVEEMIQAAIACGCDSLGFSAHSWLPFDESWTMKEGGVDGYRAEVERLRSQYSGQLKIFLGLEQDYCSAPPEGQWDYLIGSVHCVEKDGVFLSVDSGGEDLRQGVEQYFGGDYMAFAEEYYRLVGDIRQKTGCQIVGHVDLMTKHNEKCHLFDANHPRYLAAARAAIEKLAAEGAIFEINTGAISRGYRTTPYPAPEVLRMIRAAGGRICLTSDTHSVDTILFYMPQAAKLAADCGFTETMFLTEDGFRPVPLAELAL